MRAPRRTVRAERLHLAANGQWGILRHEDLVAEGMSRSAIGRRLADRRLTRLHHEVYALGHTVLRDEGIWLAAQWACGPTAVLSHFSAARFHGMAVSDRGIGPVHVTTTSARRSRPGIQTHRVRRIEHRDVFHTGHLRVTTIPRTIVDLADVLDWHALRAVADALPELHVEAIRGAQSRAPCRRGAPLITRLIACDEAHTKSEFERRFLRFLTTHSIPRPDALNARVAGHKADCVYRAHRLVIELDGRAYHRRRAQMRADRRRDVDYQLAGYRILRLVWDDLHPGSAEATAARIRRMLAA